MIILDASVAIAWCLPGESRTLEADLILSRLGGVEGIVPGLFWAEVGNVLCVAERRDRIDAAAADEHLRRLRNLPLESDHRQDDSEVLALARRHNLSAYDAIYLETAKRRNGRLATFDEPLAAAAAAEHVDFSWAPTSGTADP